ncbi:MAG: HPr kinase/phosphorylase [Roseinatronobacter sp.]
MSDDLRTVLRHGSAIAFRVADAWRGALIIGRPGTGKSELALELMGMGARLVADDQTCLTRAGPVIRLSCPDPLRGLIELRGMGILRADAIVSAELAVVVDLDQTETRRLPPLETVAFLGLPIACLRKSGSRAFASGLKQYLTAGRIDADGACPERAVRDGPGSQRGLK